MLCGLPWLWQLDGRKGWRTKSWMLYDLEVSVVRHEINEVQTRTFTRMSYAEEVLCLYPNQCFGVYMGVIGGKEDVWLDIMKKQQNWERSISLPLPLTVIRILGRIWSFLILYIDIIWKVTRTELSHRILEKTLNGTDQLCSFVPEACGKIITSLGSPVFSLPYPSLKGFSTASRYFRAF